MRTHRIIGKAARLVVETLLLPIVLVTAIEAWWRVSAPKDDECTCGCTWQKGKFYE